MSDLGPMPTPQPVVFPGSTPEERAAVGKVCDRAQNWEYGIGRDFRINCERYYMQYRGFRQFADAWTRGKDNDRDALIYEAEKNWGSHLHIPLSYRTIETVVPRAIANMPKLLITPRDEQWVKNVESVRLLIDAQQAKIDIDLPFQAVMRSGLMYGLGVGKTYWLKEEAMRRRQQKRTMRLPGLGSHFLSPPKPEVIFDDPTFEDVDVFDFMWDPMGSDMRTCNWVIHRVWLSLGQVLERVEKKIWNTVSAQQLDLDKIKSMGGGGQRYDEIWQRRMLASGFGSFGKYGRHEGDQPYEVLEYHNGQEVLTVLGRMCLVQEGENPVGAMPFQIFRPTPLSKQFVGIGALEPIEHLQRELDTLRSQRRDAATMALAASFAFDDGAILEEDLTFGPGTAIPVSNAKPADALYRIPPPEVPNSGYQEETVIREDFDAVTGMQDALNNSPGGSQSGTATEAQLARAAMGLRIELLSRRFEIEVVRHASRQFLWLDQRMITENRPAMKIPGQNTSWEEAMETGLWQWFPIGPGELEGEYEIEPEGGSMAARNIPQDRADAAWIMQNLAHDFYINPTKARLRAMELEGVKHPQAWLRDPTPSVPMAVLRLLIAQGVDPAMVQQAVIAARSISAPEEGPGASQTTQAMGEGTP